ncbi:MAG TPA: S41 family peptidase [Gemmatimonadales bacterium]
MRAPLIVLGLLFAVAPQSSAQTDYQHVQRLSAALNHIRSNHMDSVDYGDLVDAAIWGAVRSLDPHSYYLPRRTAALEGRLASGELGEIGLDLEDVDGVPTVLSVVPDGPADKKGIAPGDRLVAINDTTVAGVDLRDLEYAFIGAKGDRITLSLERGNRLEPQPYRVRIKRDHVERPSIQQFNLLDDSTGYVWLGEFGDDAAESMERALRELTRRGARRVVLDLRGNPGGRVDMSIAIASLFFPKGTVVFRTEGRKEDVVEDFVTEKDGRFRELPLIGLIDERSASASEALAGSLQDHDRALLIGRRSFGKALMQAPFRLPRGDMLWLTIGRVITPGGRFIQRRYRGLAGAQYRSFAGRTGAEADTSETFPTDAGRVMRGGGGIVPDLELGLVRSAPVWYAAAADSSYPQAIADSVGFALDESEAAFAAWLNAPDRWRQELLTPFLERVRTRLAVSVEPDSSEAAAITLMLARRAAEVRWGREAAARLRQRHDPAIIAALAAFARLDQLLAGSGTDGN